MTPKKTLDDYQVESRDFLQGVAALSDPAYRAVKDRKKRTMEIEEPLKPNLTREHDLARERVIRSRFEGP